MELTAQLVVEATRVDFAHEFHHVVFKGVDAGELHIDAFLHVALHAMPHVLQCLLLEFLGKHGDDPLFHLGENDVRVTVFVNGNGADDAFKHEDILDLGDIGHKDVLLAQVFYLLVAAAVAVHDAAALELVEILQVTEGAHRLDHLVAAAQGLDGVFGEDERIQPGVDAVLVIALDKQDGLAAAQQVEQGRVEVAARGHHLIVPCLGLGIIRLDPHALVIDARAGKLHVMGIVDEGAVGAHLLQHVPQGAHDAAVDESLGIIDQDGGIGHGI